jgi:hypothetical protein
VLQIIAMNATPSSIKVSAGKLFELVVNHMGIPMPVHVYLVRPEPGQGEPYSLCICFENTPIETQLAIDLNAKGQWVDIYDGPSELASLLGAEIGKRMKQRMYN